MVVITSLKHQIVQRMVKLRQDRSFRQKEGLAMAAGKKLILDLLPIFPPVRILTCIDFPAAPGIEQIQTTPEVIKKISGLVNPDGVVAEFFLPPPADLRHKKKLLILDSLSDPGNVGTLFRTALALGWDGVFLTPQTVDPLNDKAIRASKGACFLLPFQEGNLEELQTLLKEGRFEIYIADMEGKDISSIKTKLPVALVLGSEGKGACSETRSWGQAISIPLQKNVESLNVAIAGGILMHSLTQT